MRRKIRVLVDKSGDFTPPAGATVVAGTQYGEVAELVLLIDAGSSASSSARDAHHVRCPSCGSLFELFVARWCAHRRTRPSKVCPYCAACVCADSNYEDRRFWREAPPALTKHGIRELFVRYL